MNQASPSKNIFHSFETVTKNAAAGQSFLIFFSLTPRARASGGGSKFFFLRPETEENHDLFQRVVRGMVREGLLQMIKEEVDLLCGTSYRPQEGGLYRMAGEDPDLGRHGVY